jgi:hypothetical protein
VTATSVVVLEPWSKCPISLVVGRKGLPVGPLGQEGPMQPLQYSVLPGQYGLMKLCVTPRATHTSDNE